MWETSQRTVRGLSEDLSLLWYGCAVAQFITHKNSPPNALSKCLLVLHKLKSARPAFPPHPGAPQCRWAVYPVSQAREKWENGCPGTAGECVCAGTGSTHTNTNTHFCRCFLGAGDGRYPISLKKKKSWRITPDFRITTDRCLSHGNLTPINRCSQGITCLLFSSYFIPI